ncbi:DUF5686 and carboxypeptidase regulatory-like domain-containing protein [Gillisia sp. M10.2A]|uniref:DUF5686 and carboxypeptidase regulatory-like domain-containing protein n=1 Tax=Gillisia lutea TaxID=2909668 RepID=A0ABS9EI00_9FLAO|nr:DUF5686 and carboxypeptidase-like regulatory domain-containing protein [Gillisia lutea]MCF4101962.1 DUF5686 and carboxypeptidase regulatory-like domain-containing protein [Gillisia lutea]
MKYTFFFTLLFLVTFSVSSQTLISGVLVDEANMPVPFANVIFVNSSEGTTTDEEGNFYLRSENSYSSAEFSFVGYKPEVVSLKPGNNLNMKVIIKEEAESLSEVVIYQGKTSKKNNPALDILRKIWENKRENGVKKFDQYQYSKYEKLEFDLNTIDSSLIKSRIFNGMEFIFNDLDTNKVTGKTFLPVFINESSSKVYGDNPAGKTREILLGNKNSGFSNNQTLISSVQDVYREIDIYDNYLKFFDKNFVSPLASTGINNYNYVLADSAFIGDKWCYNIVYYPRRKNELTFKGDFWVNDTTFAIKSINLEMAESANVNWVKGVYIEQEFEALNDSIFVIKRDFFQADFSLRKKEDSRGVYGKRTVLYDNYEFNIKKPQSFYDTEVTKFQEEIYNRDDAFWEQNRLEPLSGNERGVYEMLDTLQTVKAFKRIYNISSVFATGYVEFNGWDYGPVYSTVGFNEVEGLRIRGGGRTYFGQNDPWRIEGYGAYGFTDKKFKYGISGKVLIDAKSRLILSGGNRRDIEQLGASLTNTTDVLGRSLASSSLINVGDNDKLSSINLAVVALEVEPFTNFTFRVAGSYRELKPASPTFSFDYYIDETRTETASEINQAEISTIISYSPGKETSGYGVERNLINGGDFPTLFLNYSVGLKDILNSDFEYEKIQFFYNQPLLVGGLGKANISVEAGKTFGDVPLGLLSVVPGNQTYFELYNTFSLLNFYEFVTDTYVAAHLEHNFNGRLFSRVPLLRDLNLREIIGIKGVWGEISEANKQLDASGIDLLAPSSDPYYEYSVGVGNIFKFIRIDAHFRGNYFENTDARKFGVTAAFGFHF